MYVFFFFFFSVNLLVLLPSQALLRRWVVRPENGFAFQIGRFSPVQGLSVDVDVVDC